VAKKLPQNNYQKRVHRRGEDRLRGDGIDYYLSLASSLDPTDREMAMKNLCPCHVRRQIDAVWEALYRGLQDPDLKVRQAAWHTLDDGGRPDDPKLRTVFEQIAQTETDAKLRQRAAALVQSAQKIQVEMAERIGQKAHYFRGKCDWCGAVNVLVTYVYDTEIEIESALGRLGQVCEVCEREV